ncbi:MAG: response regulator [Cyclobacteriaceae bacterium]
MLKFRFVSYALLIFVGFASVSQGLVQFISFSDLHGLSQNDVTSIHQDQNGFMWLGTNGGLNRFDGYKFVQYRPIEGDSTSISGNQISHIAEDNDHNLWFGITGRGIDRLDMKTGKFSSFKYDENDGSSLSGNFIYALFVDSNNILWVSTENGLCWSKIDESSNGKLRFSRKYLKHPFNRVQSIIEDKNGDVWFGSISTGLSKVTSVSNGKLEVIEYPLSIEGVHETDCYLEEILVLSDNEFLVSSNTRQYIYDKEKNTFTKIANGLKSTFNIDNRGNLWMGTYTRGLFFSKDFKKDPFAAPTTRYTNNYLDPYSISSNQITSSYVDRDNNIWIGTRMGINLISGQEKAFKSFYKNYMNSSLNNNHVRAIRQDSNGDFWVGTRGGGLNGLSKNDFESGNFNNFSRIRSIEPNLRLDNQNVVALEETIMEGEKVLLIGLESGGLHKLKLGNKSGALQYKSELISSLNYQSILALEVDSKKNIWVATYNMGLARIKENGKGRLFFQHDINDSTTISDNIIRDILEDRKGNLWISTAHGLNLLTKENLENENYKFKRFLHDSKDNGSISENYLLPIFEDRDGTIWIGTFGGGLNKMQINENGEVSFKVYKKADGLSGEIIKSIIQDNLGCLWIGTDNGLDCLTPQTGEIINYGVEDGLRAKEFGELASWKKSNGEIFIGSVNGVVHFTPKRKRGTPNTLKTTITDLLIFNESVQVGKKYNGEVILDKLLDQSDEINLNYRDTNFELKFVALDFVISNIYDGVSTKNKYAYKLKGIDKDWNYTNSKNRKAKYTNVPPGRYQFLVKSRNSEGIWNSPTELKINVHPPFFKTWWFRTLIGLMLVISMLLFVWYRHKQRVLLERLVKSRTIQLEKEKNKAEKAAKVKADFLSVMSHEIRTPMNAVIATSHFLNEENTNPALEEHLNILTHSSGNLLTLIDNILSFNQLDSKKRKVVNEIFDYSEIKECYQLYIDRAKEKNLAFVLENNDDIPQYLLGDKISLIEVLSNLVDNAIKFTNTGIVKLSIEVIEQLSQSLSIRFTVIDTGIGIPKENIGEIFEMFSQVNSDRNRRFEGVGLGLSISANLVKMMGGDLQIKSELGKGSTFYFTLNFPIPLESLKAKRKRLASLKKNRLKRLKALMVDDNKVNRMVLKQTLLKWGVSCEEAEDGLQALEKIENQQFDLILMDIHMPKMDGYTTTMEIRKNPLPEIRNIPIMAISADVSGEVEEKSKTVGINDSISKPFDPSVLYDKMCILTNS